MPQPLTKSTPKMAQYARELMSVYNPVHDVYEYPYNVLFDTQAVPTVICKVKVGGGHCNGRICGYMRWYLTSVFAVSDPASAVRVRYKLGEHIAGREYTPLEANTV